MHSLEDFRRMIPQLEHILGHVFHDKKLLETACVHASYTNEHKEGKIPYNERLEFLGDSVFNLIITEYLFATLPEVTEGNLSKLRASLISASSCSHFAEQLELLSFLIVGKGELLNRHKVKTSILADFFEALLGALYLDGGIDIAKKFIFENFTSEISVLLHKPQSNWKAQLQELVQKTTHETPHYQVHQEVGPDHQKHFEIGVYINKDLLGIGNGSSKKEAEQQAALCALQKLQKKQT